MVVEVGDEVLEGWNILIVDGVLKVMEWGCNVRVLVVWGCKRLDVGGFLFGWVVRV